MNLEKVLSDDSNEARGRRRSLAVGLIAAGLVVNQWSLGLLAPDGSVDLRWKIATIVAFQLFCVGVGLTLLFPRVTALVRPLGVFGLVAAFGAGSTFLALVGWGLVAYQSAHHHTVEEDHSVAAVTDEQRAWADQAVRTALRTARKNNWFDFDKAMADGFEPMWKDPEHYVNKEYLLDGIVLDPERPEFLMYLDAPEGKLLTGFMFLTNSLEDQGPQPGGSLAQWHYHPWTPEGRCLEHGLIPIGEPDEDGNCPEGEPTMRSAEMLHIWFVDHPVGRFAEAMVFETGADIVDITHLHPMLVHFTIALFAVAFLLDLLGVATGKKSFHSAAWINLLLAGVSCFATVAAGMAAEVNLMVSTETHVTLTQHKQLGFAAFLILAILVVWRLARGGRLPQRGIVLYLALAAVGTGLTFATGYYGGQLVYVEGVAVNALDRNAIEAHRFRAFGEYLESAPSDLALPAPDADGADETESSTPEPPSLP